MVNVETGASFSARAKKNKVSGFDSSDSEGDSGTVAAATATASVVAASGRYSNIPATVGNTATTQRHHHQHIPFPTTKAPIYSNLHSKPPSCSGGGGNTCYLTVNPHHKTAPYTGSGGGDETHGSNIVLVPTLEALRARAPPPKTTASNHNNNTPYIHYSAFHVYTPSLGNGSNDYTAVLSQSGNGVGVLGGGCPFIACAKCDHPVVRLQGARWVGSGGGSSPQLQDPDLYLTVRNLYPDWGRLATCRIRDYSAAAYAPTKSTTATSTKKKAVVDDFDDSDEDNLGKGAPVVTSVTSRGSGVPVDSFDDDDDDDVVVPPKPQQYRQHSTASSTAITTPSDDTDTTNNNDPYVLVEDANAAAYCCQCSWFSVIIGGGGHDHQDHYPSTPIHTTLSDITLKKHAPEFTSPSGGFITMSVNGKIASTTITTSSSSSFGTAMEDDNIATMKLLCNPHGRIRPPLWVCKGHL